MTEEYREMIVKYFAALTSATICPRIATAMASISWFCDAGEKRKTTNKNK